MTANMDTFARSVWQSIDSERIKFSAAGHVRFIVNACESMSGVQIRVSRIE